MSDRAIWKFPLTRGPRATVEMPQGARVLTVQVQDGQPTLWALVDPYEPTEPRSFIALGTGQEVSASVGRIPYIGTVQLGVFVWHIFEDTR